MNEEELATLSANLRRYGKNTAFNTETGDPVLTSNRTNPDLTYVAPRDFVTRLEQAGKTISPVTLEIQEAGADATAPPAEPVPDTTTAPAATPDTPVGEEAPPAEEEKWTEAELRQLSFNDLRKLAKLWPDVYGTKGTEHMVTTLTGKPKKPPA